MKPALLLALLLACGPGRLISRGAEQQEELAQTVATPLRATDVSPAEGASEARGPCEAGADEVCNALDDNCDGVIDEGCGLETGQLQITATWNTGADIDLYVVDPAEEVLSFQRRRSLSGGHLDHDARGDCREGQRNERLENAVWASDAPTGTYRVQLHYLFECDTGAGLTTATVSVSLGGELLGSWNQRIAPNETADVVTFRLE
ncbi:MAG: putative metal-binding motif-containing protein [Myxococcota bacterium]